VKKIFYTIIALLLCGTISAQEYALEIQSDKKVINVGKLGLPPSTTILQIIHMLPEVLSRPGTFTINNYGIQINGTSVGNLSDVVLLQLHAVDVAKIEVCESATASFTNNGEGGVINIILTDCDENLLGNISFDTSHPNTISPGLHIATKQKGWMVTGLFMGEHYNPKAWTYEVNTPGKDDPYDSYEKDIESDAQIGRVYANYKGRNDQVELVFGESTTNVTTALRGIESKEKTQSLLGHAKYTHLFSDDANIKAESEYSYTPTDVDKTSKDANALSFNTEYFQKIGTALTFIGGVTYNHAWTHIPSAIEKSNHLMPYVKATAKVGNWDLLAEVDYQYFDYGIRDKNSNGKLTDYDPHSDVTGMLSASWQFHPHRMLRLVADRKIQRQNSYTLNPIKLDEVTLDYIRDIKLENDMWILNVGGGYIHVSDVFPHTSSPYKSSDIWNLDAMATYQHSILTVSLGANLYDSQRDYEGFLSSTCTYYNLSLMPSLTFSNNLYCALSLTYNSSVKELYAEKDDCYYARMIIGKNWGHWNIHAYGQLNLGGRCTDMQYLVQYNQYTTYDLIHNTIGAGVRYNF